MCVVVVVVTIIPYGCTEFPEFSMLREILEYSRFSKSVGTLLDITNIQKLLRQTQSLTVCGPMSSVPIANAVTISTDPPMPISIAGPMTW